MLSKKRRQYFVYYRAFLQRRCRAAAAGAVLKPVGRELCGAAVRGNIYVPGTDFVGLERYPAR